MSAKSAIDTVIHSFFGIFNNKDQQPDWNLVRTLCIPETLIIKKEGLNETVYNLDSFIEPRKKILSDGTLTEFEEMETGEQTTISGNIAQRASQYRKSGLLNGKPFEGSGRKFFQLINTPGGWKINAVLWEDDLN
jgi:hypothetical protein